MNNLLQSLSNKRLKLCTSDTDLKRLLSAVKEGRSHDSKLSDAFYESLEGVLLDLRVVTIDNRDADAFLRPVSKTDYPDYYEIIANPMDLQTMLKKVKQKQYKSKREFADDLELIWSNCHVYNTGDNHPLRLCAKRLRAKADRLLKNVTDRRDRMDPQLPANLLNNMALPKPNGVMVNGHSRQHSSPPVAKSKSPSVVRRETPTPARQPLREVSFLDMPAFVRTASGMSTFMELDAQLAGPSTSTLPNYGRNSTQDLAERLRNIAGTESESEEEEFGVEVMNGEIGEKRKLALNGSYRPRKRSKGPAHIRKPEHAQEPVELWWEATRSCALMTNAVPTLTYSSSHISKSPSSQLPVRPIARKKGKRKKKKKQQQEQQSSTLLRVMNNNIRTMKRVRRTHDKFLALNLNSEEGAAGAAGGSVEPPEPVVADEDIDVQVDEKPWVSSGHGIEMGEQEADGCLQWMGGKVLEHAGFQGASKAALSVFTGVTSEYLLNVGRTMRFLCDKYSQTMSAEEIILHTLFESGITHIRDLERYIKDDVVRYGSRLADLEKKLVGAYREVTAVEALDDDALFRNEDDEEEDSEFVMGGFADAFGEDFLGLRELGIAGEHGLSSLSVPKKLLKGKDKGRLGNVEDGAKPTEPPPPYPPPPPFVLLDSRKLGDQIGLLQPFYAQKFNAITPSAAPLQPGQSSHPHPPPPPARPPSTVQLPLEFQLSAPTLPKPPTPASSPVLNPSAPPIVIPDDPPNPARTKIGPLGVITKPGLPGAAKKKAKAKEVSGGAAAGSGRDGESVSTVVSSQNGPASATADVPGSIGGGDAAKKKKSGGGGKKKDKAKSEATVPPVIVAA